MIKKLIENKKITLIFFILIATEIFYFSSLSKFTKNQTQIWQLIPMIYHFSVFFLLCFFIFASVKELKKIKIFSIVFVLIISIIFAILDEIHQIFVPFRDASFNDVLVDSLGIFTSALIYIYINKNSKNN